MFGKLGQMGQLASMMKNLQSMQSSMAAMKQELASSEYQGKSQDNLVEASVSGEFVVRRISISPALMTPDNADLLAASVTDAVNRAIENAKADAARKLSQAAGGMDLSALQ